MLKLLLYRILCIAACMSLLGCSAAQFNRELENAMGSLARERVETLGSPSKECSLVRLKVSKSYAIVMGTYTIRLGEEYPRVRTVAQLSDGSTDYAVLECGKEDGSFRNFLLRIPPSASQMALFVLSSVSNKPFSSDTSRRPVMLLQDGDIPGQLRVWFLDSSGVRGPGLTTYAKLYGAGDKKQARASSGGYSGGSGKTASRASKSSGRPDTPSSQPDRVKAPDFPDMPIIVPSSSVRIERDEPGRQSGLAEPGTQSAPKAAEPQISAPAASPAPPKPVIIIDEPASPPVRQDAPGGQPRKPVI